MDAKSPETNSGGLIKAMMRKKSISKGISQTTTQKTLNWYDLTAYGIAATVGSGIYVSCGRVALVGGPSVILSTAIAGFLSLLTGICYLEFASSLPISGSGYAYFYTTLGEFLGWVIGWNLTLEYSFAAAAIAGGWSNYFVAFLKDFGFIVPVWMYDIPLLSKGGGLGWLEESFIKINFLAAISCLFIGLVVSRGIHFGTILTNVITCINIGIILFIIITGSFSISTDNWSVFAPAGYSAILSGAGEMFFSFIGYDTITSLAGEAVNPGRDLPIAFTITIVTATLLYMGVGIVLTGMQNYTLLDEKSPLSVAFLSSKTPWASSVVGICALLTMAATMFTCIVGQPKIFQSISQDGLLPKFFSRTDRNGTPRGSVFFTTILTAVTAMCFDVNNGLIDMISFGTLLGMSLLCAGLLAVRFNQEPSISRTGIKFTILFFIGSIVASVTASFTSSAWIILPIFLIFVCMPMVALIYLFVVNSASLSSSSLAFSCPLMPITPCIAIFSNIFVIFYSPNILSTLVQFAVWTIGGLIIYFTYGIKHSHLNEDEEKLLNVRK